MSEDAFLSYSADRVKQRTKGEARRIRIKVANAKGSRHSASLRWPFELLQNALDSGPRPGRRTVAIRLRVEESAVYFEHDGAPFSTLELAALLSGGSSKEFDSDTTTGRYGSGFLVTHVLAEQMRLVGILQAAEKFEQFEVLLDRSGDEEMILKNIESCDDSVKAACKLVDISTTQSAVFCYPSDQLETTHAGIQAMRNALPYLYATRPMLGRTEFAISPNDSEVWEPTDSIQTSFDGNVVISRSLSVIKNGAPAGSLNVYRIQSSTDAKSAALMVTHRVGSETLIETPHEDLPRIFREYPVAGATFIPSNIIFDGKFELDEERQKVQMHSANRELIADGISAATAAVKFAVSNQWKGIHKLCRVAPPTSSFEPENREEQKWWKEELRRFALTLSKQAVVETESSSGFIPADTDADPHAHFPIPCLLSSAESDEFTVDEMWPVVQGVSHLWPPKRELANEWHSIASGWHKLGVPICRVALEEVAETARDGISQLSELRIMEGESPTKWLVEFLKLVGVSWNAREGIDDSVLHGMLPDQSGFLRSPSELGRGNAISKSLQNLCNAVGWDIHSEMLSADLLEEVSRGNHESAMLVLEKVTSGELSEAGVLVRAIERLRKSLPDDKEWPTDKVELKAATVAVIAYLRTNKVLNSAELARQIPFLTRKGSVGRWATTRKFIAPVVSWPKGAQPFCDCYPPDRVLADIYAGEIDDTGEHLGVDSLVLWEIAFREPLYSENVAELKSPRLSRMSKGAVDGMVVRDETFSQIALLSPEVLNRCQENIEYAKALIGLVVCYVAQVDNSWYLEKSVCARVATKELPLTVHGALWLADLQVRQWLPFKHADGEVVKTNANISSIQPLLETRWLESNDDGIRLLSQRFGFDELELRLLGVEPDVARRQMVRDGLARLVETGGGNLSVYHALADELDKRKQNERNVAHCRRLGIAVQEAIGAAIELHGLKATLIDKGFDFLVEKNEIDELEDITVRMEIGGHLLEVKATTTGHAHMTPLQAETAARESDRYTLCVVDIRGIPESELELDWDADRVVPLAHLVPGIGREIQSTCELVEAARLSAIGIRNVRVLRYAVSPSLWESGLSIEEWVLKTVKPTESDAA